MGDMLDNAGAQLVVSGRHQQYLDYASASVGAFSLASRTAREERFIAAFGLRPGVDCVHKLRLIDPGRENKMNREAVLGVLYLRDHPVSTKAPQLGLVVNAPLYPIGHVGDVRMVERRAQRILRRVSNCWDFLRQVEHQK